MRIREYQLDKIEEARRVQQECLRLHLPCPPVLHWGYEVKAADGKIVEIGKGKANSYTRNALNILAYNVGLCTSNILNSTSFIDGIVNVKTTSVSLSYSYLYRYNTTAVGNDPKIYLGSGSDAESLDSYLLPSITLNAGSNICVSSFNATTRKLITTISRPYTNGTGSSVNVTESTIAMYVSTAGYLALMVRDKFDAIAVADGETITWTYTIEVAYPNP